MADLETTTVEAEQVKETSNEESAKQVSPENEQVSSITEEDVTKRIEEALTTFKGSEEYVTAVQSAKDKSIGKETQPLRDKILELEKTMTNQTLGLQEKRELEDLGDTKEVRDWQVERRKISEATYEVTQQKEANKLFAETLSAEAKTIKAHRLSTDKDIDLKELLKCETPEEMDSLSLKLENESLKTQLAEKDKPPQKLDSGTNSAQGVNLKDMSPVELIKLSLDQKK